MEIIILGRDNKTNNSFKCEDFDYCTCDKDICQCDTENNPDCTCFSYNID